MQIDSEGRVTGPWRLDELNKLKSNGLNVFSCFHCGGGSSMGYKLAGYNVLGGVEIDPEMMSIYQKNHKPKHSFHMGVQDFKVKDYELPTIDVLDGSPPCSSFSMSGSREKAWGDKKKFREGQVEQMLDTLFFDFIDIAEKFKPRVVVAENVKGLIIGNARGYVKQIFAAFDKAEYTTQLFLLNASRMGVPQRRERTFFVARRKDLSWLDLKIEFNERKISLKDAIWDLSHDHEHRKLTESSEVLWRKCLPGKSFSTVHEKGHRFNWSRESWFEPTRTIASTNAEMICHPSQPRPFCRDELIRIQTFPDDYDFLNQKPGYVTGMSVPPFMIQRLALEIKRQWFDL